MEVNEHCSARAALAGNPSDGYGGAVVALPISPLRATVNVRPHPRFEFATTEPDTPPVSLSDIHSLESSAASTPAADDHALAIAAVAEVSRRWGAPPSISVTIDSSIPRSVGLAGSSAIVIATLRAVLRVAGHSLPHPDLIASVAHSIEVERLDIPAGLQDRIVQAHDRPMAMRFGSAELRRVDGFDMGTYTPVDLPSNARLLVAWQPSASAPSQIVHGDLAGRFRDGDPAVHAAMHDLAHQAEVADGALARNDVTALGHAMDATFDLRASILELDPAHVAMVDAARSVGAFANYTGSGGSVVVLAADAPTLVAAEQSLDSIGAATLRCQDDDVSSP